MANQQPDHTQDRPAEFQEEEDYVGQDEVAEEVEGDEGGEPMSEDEDDQAGPAGGEGGQSVLVDDSVQGFFDHREDVYAVAIHPTQQHLVASGGGDDKCYLWRLDNGEKVFDLGVHTDSVSAIGFSNDGQYVASAGLDGKVIVHNVSNGQHVVTLEGPTEITWLEWHPRGPIVLVGSEDATIWMWQVPSGNCMGVLTGHGESVTCGQFTPDGKTIVSGSSDGSFAVWNPKTATAQLRIGSEDARFHSAPITALADGSARLVHLGNGRILASLDGHTDSVETIGFCNTMPWAATGSVDGTISIWDVTTMQIRSTLRHDDAVTKVIWHETAPLLTSASTDKTVRVWDARTGECLKVWRGHQAPIMDLAITRDGNRAVTASDDGTALVFAA
ncbi:hypothetical protein HK097_011286 [Rhizophlyctis rosea]|uniref:Anaphase-promoting complex subunit 4-like WD40 domain-containing protein n=1 Tax=Rhizophlyctis rosea TaxID=64517 RepID=A0AAD5X373_9FUNG|nr:hypothetical protein HK097_011286 [Rhizophlyctis rosea]